MACPTGKMRRPDRADAKREVKRLKKLGASHLTAYECDRCLGWHVGHAPPALIRGDIARDEISHHRWDRERVLGT